MSITPDSIESEALDLTWVLQRRVAKVTMNEPNTWFFDLGGSSGISAECLWRIIENDTVKLTSDDHGQQFGNQTQIDAAVEASKLLNSVPIEDINIAPGTADITVNLQNRLKLQIIPISSGYESWHIYSPSRRVYTAQGAGKIVTYLDT